MAISLYISYHPQQNSLVALTNCVQVSYHTRVQLPRNKFEIKPAAHLKRRGGVCCIKIVAQANRPRPKSKRKQLAKDLESAFITRAFNSIWSGAQTDYFLIYISAYTCLPPSCASAAAARMDLHRPVMPERGAFFFTKCSHTRTVGWVFSLFPRAWGSQRVCLRREFIPKWFSPTPAHCRRKEEILLEPPSYI